MPATNVAGILLTTPANIKTFYTDSRAGVLYAEKVCSWPGPGFPGGRRKLTLAGRTIAPKVSFLAPPRTHTGGQERPVGL